MLAAEDELKIQLEGMEQKLLADLASSEGNILENKTLLISLNELKSKSTTVKEKLEEASVLQARSPVITPRVLAQSAMPRLRSLSITR